MTPEQIEELQAQAPKELPEAYKAVAHVYVAFIDGVNALNHVINHALHDTALPPELRAAGKALLDATKEPFNTFGNALEAASDATASPELREFKDKVAKAMQPQVTLSEDGVIDFSNKPISGVSH